MKTMYVLLLAAAAFATACVSGAARNTHPARLVNGVVIEGTIQDVSEEGMVIQTPKGKITYPWRYLSRGTRNRYRSQATSVDADEDPPRDADETPPAKAEEAPPDDMEGFVPDDAED